MYLVYESIGNPEVNTDVAVYRTKKAAQARAFREAMREYGFKIGSQPKWLEDTTSPFFVRKLKFINK